MNGAEIRYLCCPFGCSFTGALLLTGESGGVLIDAALPESVESFLLPRFRSCGFPVSALRLVVNTHCHDDHAGGNAVLRTLCDARFAIHSAGAAGMEKAGFRPDLTLEDGSEIAAAGFRFEIIHTPGHSPDSVCVLEPESGTLFAGDAFQGRGTPFTGVALYSDPEAYLRSVAKMEDVLRRRVIRRMFCGHACAPYDGEVPGGEIPEFLGICRRTVMDYARTADEYAAAHPRPDAAELGRLLLKKFGTTDSPGLPGLEKCTAEAHLSSILRSREGRPDRP